MASERQIVTNRQKVARGTGARTPGDKSRTSLDALNTSLFARLKHKSAALDNGAPLNERQERLLDAEGKVRQEREEDLILPAMGFWNRTFTRLARGERRKFIVAMRELIGGMEEKLNQDENVVRRPVVPG
jgi:hypothetical protein